MELQQSFRAIAKAVDQLPSEQATDFLAKLVLILANEVNDGKKVEAAVQRAMAAMEKGDRA